MKKLVLLLLVIFVILLIDQKTHFLSKSNWEKALPFPQSQTLPNGQKQIIVSEESVITKVVADSIPSVVTVSETTTTQSGGGIQINPFNPLNPFQQIPGQTQKVDQNIGSGFIVTTDGLIITNKHVVADPSATYKVITDDKKTYSVDKIYRDPLNDLAILKINASGLKPLSLGNSSRLKLGQLVIAIGTPLGEFTNTVTNGIISGLGRGITAGSPFEGSVEKLDNVIQTNAAINPGNSGGPLLNSSGQAIGINTAIAQQGQNIGFAIPINVVNDLLTNFQKNGQNFSRPFIGIRYKMIDQQTAVLNNIVQGAYVVEVVAGSPADQAGIQADDIVTEFDGQKVQGSDDQGLANMILQKKVGDTVNVKIWRNNTVLTKQVTLVEAQ